MTFRYIPTYQEDRARQRRLDRIKAGMDFLAIVFIALFIYFITLFAFL
jgi:hypothetical protein